MSYAGYGQSSYGQSSPPQPSGQIRMEAISEAWGYVREQMGVWVLAMVVYFVINFAVVGIISALSGSGTQTSPSNPTPAYFISLIGRSSGSNVVTTIIGSFFMVGMFRMALKQIRGESISVGDLFSGGDAVLPMIGANLLIGLIIMAAALVAVIPMVTMIVAKNSLAWIPGIIAVVLITLLNTRLFLVPAIVADGRGGALGSVKQSFEATNGQTLNAFLLMIVLGLVMILGALACGIGLLFAYPIFPLTIAIVYRDLLGTEGGMRGPQLDIPLPPSSAYGSTPPRVPGQPPPYGQVPGDMQGRGTTMPGTPPPPGQDPPTPGQMGQIKM